MEYKMYVGIVSVFLGFKTYDECLPSLFIILYSIFFPNPNFSSSSMSVTHLVQEVLALQADHVALLNQGALSSPKILEIL